MIFTRESREDLVGHGTRDTSERARRRVVGGDEVR